MFTLIVLAFNFQPFCQLKLYVAPTTRPCISNVDAINLHNGTINSKEKSIICEPSDSDCHWYTFFSENDWQKRGRFIENDWAAKWNERKFRPATKSLLGDQTQKRPKNLLFMAVWGFNNELLFS
jgi:hypothetical protein